MNKTYNPSILQKYLSGLLEPGEMHQIEKDALNDPFLQDALDGLATLESKGQPQLSALQKRLAVRLQEQVKEKNRSYFNFQRLAIASTAAVLLIAVCVLFWMRQQTAPASGNKEQKQIQVNLTSAPRIIPIEGNGQPAIGWERYAESLAHLEGLKPGSSIQLRIQIEAGKVQSAQITEGTSSAEAQALRDNILQSTGWKGDSVTLEFHY